jgi:hypothetical protein
MRPCLCESLRVQYVMLRDFICCMIWSLVATIRVHEFELDHQALHHGTYSNQFAKLKKISAHTDRIFCVSSLVGLAERRSRVVPVAQAA